MTEHDSSTHRELRELLGAYALSALDEMTRTRLRAHLDGCHDCRVELAEIAPLADALRGVNVDAVTTGPGPVPFPPPDLGDRVVARVVAERELAQARARRDQRRTAVRQRTRQLTAVAAAAALGLSGLAAGTALGRASAPETTATPKAVLPVEDISLRALDTSIKAESAVVVAHTWGLEAKFKATGLGAGEVYRAAFRAEDGRVVPAGEFLGVGDKTLTCNMQSALLRDDAAEFFVTDEAGRTVLVAQL